MVSAGAPEGYVVPTPQVAPVVLLCYGTGIVYYIIYYDTGVVYYIMPRVFFYIMTHTCILFSMLSYRHLHFTFNTL